MSERMPQTNRNAYSASPGEKSHMDAVRAYAKRQAEKKEAAVEPDPSSQGVALELRPTYDPAPAQPGYEYVDGEAVVDDGEKEEDDSAPEANKDIVDAEVVEDARARVLEEYRRQAEQAAKDSAEAYGHRDINKERETREKHKANQHWRDHVNELKADQQRVRRQVEADDKKEAYEEDETEAHLINDRMDEEKARAEFAAKVEAKNNLRGRRNRANQMKNLAIANNSIEVAEKIVNRRKWLVDPIRLPGSDKKARNEALLQIAQNNPNNEIGLEATLKITNKLIRNRALGQLGKAKLSPQTRGVALRIAGEIKGPENRKLKPELLTNIALSYDDLDEALQFVEDEGKDKRTKDIMLVALVKKYKKADIIKKINTRQMKQMARELL